MRYKIGVALFSVALLVFLVVPPTQGQGKKSFGGFGGFGGGDFGGFGGRNRDPNQMFDFLAKGRPYFLVTETTRLREPLTQFLQTKGITNGQVTRELFSAYNEQAKSAFGGPGGFAGPGMNTMVLQGTPGSPFSVVPQTNPVDMINQWAEADFKTRDRNGDGFLNQDEMPDQLKNELSKWDTNRDNLISLDEYKIYFAARMQTRGRRGGNESVNPVTIILEDEDLETRPIVYRAGKLPTKELPPWFMDLDIDKDGQIALWEWRKAGKDLDEFREWDRNNDGFITPEEALYKQRFIMLASAKSKAEEGGDNPAQAVRALRGPDDMGPPMRDFPSDWGGKGKKGGKGGKGGKGRPQ
jgi:hypothetical protein